MTSCGNCRDISPHDLCVCTPSAKLPNTSFVVMFASFTMLAYRLAEEVGSENGGRGEMKLFEILKYVTRIAI